MIQQLNKMEISLLESIIEENRVEYPFLSEHIKFLYVKNRENTGVGIYSNFGYLKDLKFNDVNVIISSSKTLKINGFKDEITYVLDISNGKINFLEIVANGNDMFIENKFIYDFELF